MKPGETIKMTKEEFEGLSVSGRFVNHVNPYAKTILATTEQGTPIMVSIDYYSIAEAMDHSPQVAHSFKKLWPPRIVTGKQISHLQKDLQIPL